MSRYHDEFGPGINQQCLLLHCTSAGKSHPYIDSLPELFPDLLSQDKYDQILKTKTTHVDMLYCCGLSRTRISNYFDFDIYDLVSYPYHRWFCTLKKCAFRKKTKEKTKNKKPHTFGLFTFLWWVEVYSIFDNTIFRTRTGVMSTWRQVGISLKHV